MNNGLTAATLLLCAVCLDVGLLASDAGAPSGKKVYVLPIRDEIAPPMVFLVRRGVKQAMEEKSELVVLDMETNGGRVDSMMEIIKILNNFKGQTVTYVNDKAFSAGALISFATQKIYMAPGAVIGAAAPVVMSPGGGGTESMPDTIEVKSASAISAMMRVNAEKNGHNTEVVDAMVKKTKELVIDGHVINRKGDLLTLTDTEARAEYGNPPKPLLSLGTVDSIDKLLEKLGYAQRERVNVEPTGAERVAFWINAISPLLLIIGIVGIYIEFKTPGFGLPGIVGIIAFALYFLGSYIAGFSGMEWVAVFIVGLALVALELFVFPGTAVLGLAGAALMLVALVMAMVDVYPGMPSVPTFEKLELPLRDLLIAFVGAAVAVGVLSRWLPRTSIYGKLVSQTASGVNTVIQLESKQASEIGQVGVALSPLRPGGKAQFGSEILDVMSQGEMIEKGRRVKIIGHSGTEAIVEAVS
ncbi:MAG TPA: NfeD family protein [Verrucomicrobiae bacterium]|nr:NfeD family protein [Verrucomicrobiae bacterium]